MVLVDAEGFLRDRQQWNEAIATEMAAAEGIELSDDHWAVMHLVRDYYESYRLFPQNRVLIKRMAEQLGEDKGSSIHLMRLFTGKPARTLAKLAGLPKPPHCE